MALDAVLFDLDGTLLDTNRTHADAWVEGLAASGHPLPFDRIAPEIGKGGDLLLPTLLGEEAAARDGDAIRDRVKAAFRRLASERAFRVFDGAESLLADLRARGLRLALATSAGEDDLETMMRSAGVDLREAFDAVVTKSDVERSKPEPDVIIAAAAKLGVSPAQCAMVGDTPFDATAAHRAGAVTLGVLSSGLDDEPTLRRRLLEAGARRVWRDVGALAADIDAALHVASPSRLRLSVAEQERLMRAALDVAREREGTRDPHGDAPIACVIFDGAGEIVARAVDGVARDGHPFAHAELDALRQAAQRRPEGGDRDAHDLVLVCTIEPCPMCVGAATIGAVDTILFGLPAGAAGGTRRVVTLADAPHRLPRMVGGVLADESRALLRSWLAGAPDGAQARQVRGVLADTASAGAD